MPFVDAHAAYAASIAAWVWNRHLLRIEVMLGWKTVKVLTQLVVMSQPLALVVPTVTVTFAVPPHAFGAASIARVKVASQPPVTVPFVDAHAAYAASIAACVWHEAVVISSPHTNVIAGAGKTVKVLTQLVVMSHPLALVVPTVTVTFAVPPHAFGAASIARVKVASQPPVTVPFVDTHAAYAASIAACVWHEAVVISSPHTNVISGAGKTVKVLTQLVVMSHPLALVVPTVTVTFAVPPHAFGAASIARVKVASQPPVTVPFVDTHAAYAASIAACVWHEAVVISSPHTNVIAGAGKTVKVLTQLVVMSQPLALVVPTVTVTFAVPPHAFGAASIVLVKVASQPPVTVPFVDAHAAYAASIAACVWHEAVVISSPHTNVISGAGKTVKVLTQLVVMSHPLALVVPTVTVTFAVPPQAFGAASIVLVKVASQPPVTVPFVDAHAAYAASIAAWVWHDAVVISSPHTNVIAGAANTVKVLTQLVVMSQPLALVVPTVTVTFAVPPHAFGAASIARVKVASQPPVTVPFVDTHAAYAASIVACVWHEAVVISSPHTNVIAGAGKTVKVLTQLVVMSHPLALVVPTVTVTFAVPPHAFGAASIARVKVASQPPVTVPLVDTHAAYAASIAACVWHDAVVISSPHTNVISGAGKTVKVLTQLVVMSHPLALVVPTVTVTFAVPPHAFGAASIARVKVASQPPVTVPFVDTHAAYAASIAACVWHEAVVISSPHTNVISGAGKTVKVLTQLVVMSQPLALVVPTVTVTFAVPPHAFGAASIARVKVASQPPVTVPFVDTHAAYAASIAACVWHEAVVISSPHTNVIAGAGNTVKVLTQLVVMSQPLALVVPTVTVTFAVPPHAFGAASIARVKVASQPPVTVPFVDAHAAYAASIAACVWHEAVVISSPHTNVIAGAGNTVKVLTQLVVMSHPLALVVPTVTVTFAVPPHAFGAASIARVKVASQPPVTVPFDATHAAYAASIAACVWHEAVVISSPHTNVIAGAGKTVKVLTQLVVMSQPLALVVPTVTVTFAVPPHAFGAASIARVKVASQPPVTVPFVDTHAAYAASIVPCVWHEAVVISSPHTNVISGAGNTVKVLTQLVVMSQPLALVVPTVTVTFAVPPHAFGAASIARVKVASQPPVTVPFVDTHAAYAASIAACVWHEAVVISSPHTNVISGAGKTVKVLTQLVVMSHPLALVVPTVTVTFAVPPHAFGAASIARVKVASQPPVTVPFVDTHAAYAASIAACVWHEAVVISSPHTNVIAGAGKTVKVLTQLVVMSHPLALVVPTVTVTFAVPPHAFGDASIARVKVASQPPVTVPFVDAHAAYAASIAACVWHEAVVISSPHTNVISGAGKTVKVLTQLVVMSQPLALVVPTVTVTFAVPPHAFGDASIARVKVASQPPRYCAIR
ncbi:MAG: hypothetical protein IPQ18_12715 [Saprospiraceae bacterium]|nr:hypothetical protein [Saprospiraceae bacterium]